MILLDKDLWVNDIKVYVDLLIKINRDYLRLVGLDCIDDSYKIQKKFLELTRDITIFFPKSHC